MGYDKNDIELPEGYAALPDGYEEMPETTTPEMPEGYTALPDGYELPDETPKPTNPMSRSIDNQTNTGSPYEQALQEANVPVPEIMPKSQVLFGEGKDYENPTAPDWNTGKLLVNRSNELLGNMAKGIGRWTDEANQFIGGDPDGAIKSMGKEFDEWVTKDKLDGKEVHSWEQVKDAFKKGGLFDVDTIQEALNFGAEQGIKSIADMGFITLNLPAYMVSRGQEMADERMVEKGLKGQEPTVEDMGIGLLGGVVSGMLEKIGLKATTGDIVEALSKELVGKTYEESLRIFAKEVTKGTLKEAGTEFVQEGAIEPTTERIGTGSKKPLLDIDRGMAGAVGGMTAGGGISTISGVGTEAFNRSGAGRRSLFKQRDQLIADEMDSYELIPKTAQEDAIEAREVGRSRGLTQVGQQFEQAKQTWETATPEQKQQFKQELILAVQEDPDKALVEVAGLLPYLTDEQGTDIITAVAEVATPEEMKQLEILINGEQQPEAALNKSETYELNQLEEKEASGELEGDEVWRMEDLQMKREGIGQNEQETAQNEPVPVEPKQEVKEEVKEPITQSKENELSDTAEPTEPKVTRQKRITQIKKHPRFKEVVGFIEAARGYELNRNKRMSPADLKLQMESEGLDKSQDEYKDRMTALMEIRREESPLDAFSNFTATELNQLKKGTVSSAMLEKMEDAIGEIENNPDFNQVQPEAKVNIADNIAEQVAAETALGQPKLFNTKDKLLKAKGKKEFITNVSTPKGNKLFNVNTLKKKEEPVKQTPKEEITVNNAYTFPKEEQLPFWKDMLTQEKSKYLGDANKRKMYEDVIAELEEPTEDTQKYKIGTVDETFTIDPDQTKVNTKEGIAVIGDDGRKIITVESALTPVKKDKYNQKDYDEVYEAMPTETTIKTGTQNSLFGQGQLFDTKGGEAYTVPKWAKPLVSDTTRYEDVLQSITAARTGDVSPLADRAVEAFKKNGTIDKKETQDATIRKPKERLPTELQQDSTGSTADNATRAETQQSDNDAQRPGDTGGEPGAARPTEPIREERGGAKRSPKPGTVKNQFTISQNDAVTQGEVARFKDNFTALQIIKADKPFHTKEDLQQLSRYTGWGGVEKLFPNQQGVFENKTWRERNQALQKVLTEEEYKTANQSILDAFYTPPEIISAMWQISEQLGFDGGHVLEPSLGTGRFIGMTPQGIKQVSFSGTELDGTTAKIAAILYQKSNIRNIGFEKTNHIESFEMVIGNPPYGNFKVYDPANKPLNKLSIHNYFVVKSLQAIKPGGVVNFVVTSSLMENMNQTTANMINEKAKLVAAIRLPSNVFKGAGTQVTTDIVIFQKLNAGEEGNIEEWFGKEKQDNGINLNKYFANNPDMMLGEWKKAFRGNTLEGNPDTFNQELQKVIESLPKDIMPSFQGEIRKQFESTADISIPPSTFYKKDGKYFVNTKVNEGVQAEPVNTKVAKYYIPLRDSLSAIIEAQNSKTSTDAQLKEKRTALNKNYDSFKKNVGLLSRPATRNIIVNDRMGFTVHSLEVDGKKAPIFTKRTSNPNTEVRTKDTNEALNITLNTKGFVDLEELQTITGKTEDQILNDLKGEVFFDVKENKYVSKDIYLSGDVKSKLEEATDDLAVKELLKVIPEDLEGKDIPVQIGVSWITPKYVQDFANEVMGMNNALIAFDGVLGKWKVNVGYTRTNPFEIPKVSAADTLEKALNNKQIKVTFTQDGKSYINEEGTAYANQKLEELKDAFNNWIFADAKRAAELIPKYNDLFNRTAPLNVEDGASNHVIPGMAKKFIPRKHQNEAVYRAVYGNSPLLLDHPVGSGKTLTSQMIAMEWKRLGIANKPVIATLKSVLPQFAKEFRIAYPNANLLVPEPRDFTKDNIKKLMSTIATGDFDAIILSHENLKSLNNPAETMREVLQEKIDELNETLLSGAARSKKEIIKKIKDLQDKFDEVTNTQKRDDVLSFDQLGIDGLIVDESHKHKKIGFSTSMQVKGLDSDSSQVAVDLLIKTRHILKNSNNVVLMTGTPITNTLPELYSIQKMLQPDLLKKQGIYAFDSWAAQYTVTETDVEVTGTGVFKEVTRIKQYVNLDALYQSTGQIFDTVHNEEVAANDKTFVIPPVKGGAQEAVILPASPEQENYVQILSDRLEVVNQKDNDDNYLAIFGDANKMSLDMRLIDPSLPDVPGSKANVATDRAVEIYKAFDKHKGTQLIFTDMGIPNRDGRFDLYNDIKKKLIAKGIPANEIALISDYGTATKKLELSDKVNEGKVRFVIGGTQTLGTGINMQKKLVAVHHLDIPLTPAMLEQRNGRILRQGNTLVDSIPNFEIEIFNYATEKTLDATKWQILKNKATFIEQFKKGEADTDMDLDEGSAKEQAEKMIALASGNPLLLDRVKAEKKLKKLRALQRGYNTARADKKNTLYMHEEVLATGDQKLQNFRVDKLEADTNEIKINGKTFEKQAELGQAVLNEIQKYKDGRGTRGKIIGSVGNLDIQIGYNYGSDTAVVKIIGAAEQSFQVNFISQGDIGMGAKIANAADPSNYQSDINSIQYQMKDAKERIPALKKSIGEKFSKQDELAETETELADLNEQMKAEAKPEKEEGTDEAPLDYKGERIPVDQTLTKFQRAHLHALRKRAGNPKIIQKNSIIISEKDGSQVAGQYNGKKHEVYVSKGYGGTYQVLYHELVHALYTKIIKENKKFQFELNGITEEVRKNFEERGLDIPNIYGMSDIHEFLPEFFSNAEFRKELDNMPYTRNGKEVKSKTLLDKVMEFFKKILGDKKGTVTEEINKLLNEYKTEAENLAQNKKPGEDITSDMKMDSSKDPMRAGFIELGTVLSTPSRGVNLIKNKIDEAVSDHLTGKIKDTKVDAFIRRYLGGSMAGLGMLTRKQEQQFVKLYRKMKADVSKGEMNAEAAAALIEEHFGQIDTTVFETIMGEDLPTYLGTENTDPEIQLNDALYKQMYNAIVIRYLENPTAREEIAEIFPDLASELDMVRDYIDEMSKDAMSRGILLPSQFNRWKDKYLSRLYLVQNSDLDQATSQAKAGIKMGKVASGRKIESIIDYIAEFPEEAQRMGVVLDPELMVKITIAKTQGNISLEEFFRSIAYSTEVIDSRHTISLDEPIANLPTTFSPFYAEKKIIPYIHDMIGNIEKEIENGEYDETAIAQFEDYIEQLKQDIADIKEEAQAIGSLKGSFDKDKYAMIPEDIRYGAIAGLPVSKDLASMVKSQFNIVKDPEMFAEKLDKAGSKYLTYFKWAKVPANVFAYSRNLASNQFQWAMSGADPVTFAPEWIRGLDSYVRKDAWYDKARAEGLIDDNQMTFEVNQELKKMLQDLEVQGKGKSALAKVNKFMQWVGEKYGAIDDVAKIARMRYAVETDGKTQFEGAQIAQDTHYDYGLTYDIVRSIRDPNITRATLGKLLFTLFPTYTQKTIAFMYESIIERPFTMATMSAAIALILSYDTDDEEAKKSMTDKEWVSFQKSIPDWIQNSPFIRVDYEKDRHGEWIATFTDVGNVIPFGSIVAGAYAIGTGDITEGLGKFGAGGSPFQIVGNLINNKDSFTQRQIYYPHDPAKKAEGIGKYIAGQLAPGTIMRGISLVETRHPVIPRIGGVNSYVYSIKDLERMQEGKAGAIKRDAGRQSSKYRSKLRRAKADFDKGDLSTEKYLKIKAAAEEKIDEWKEQGLEDYREISPTATTEIDFKQEMKYSKDTAKELKDLLGRVKRSQQDKDLYAQSRKGVNMKALKDLEALRLLTEKEVRKQRANLKILSKTKMGDEKRTKYRKKFNNTIDRAYEVGLKKIMATKKKYNIK